LENEKYQDFLNSNFVLYKINVGEESYVPLKEKFPVKGTPTVVTINNSGNKIDEIIGYMPPADKYIEKLKKAVKSSGPYYKGTFEEAHKKSISDNKMLLLYFSSPT